MPCWQPLPNEEAEVRFSPQWLRRKTHRRVMTVVPFSCLQFASFSFLVTALWAQSWDKLTCFDLLIRMLWKMRSASKPSLKSRLITILPSFATLAYGPGWSQSYLLCHLGLLIQHRKEWDVEVTTQDHFVTEGWKLIDDFLRYIPGLTVRHGALESPRVIPFFFITFLQLVCLCRSSEACFVLYKLLQHRENSVLLSHFLSPMHKEQNGTRYVRPAFCIYLSRYSPHCFKNCNTLV